MSPEKPKLGVDPLGWIGAAQEKTAKEAKASTPRTPPKATASPRKAQEPTKTTEAGLPEGWNRATFIVRKEHLEKLKGLSYHEDRTLKELVDEALGTYLKGKKVQTRGGK